MGKEVVLVKKCEDAKRVAGPRDGWVQLLGQKMGLEGKSTFFSSEDDQPSVGFADAFPFLLVSKNSLDDIEVKIKGEKVETKIGFDKERWGREALGKKGLEIERFRGNIIIDGGKPWEEDGWGEIKFVAPAHEKEETIMYVMLRCARCMVSPFPPFCLSLTDSFSRQPSFDILLLSFQTLIPRLESETRWFLIKYYGPIAKELGHI